MKNQNLSMKIDLFSKNLCGGGGMFDRILIDFVNPGQWESMPVSRVGGGRIAKTYAKNLNTLKKI